MLIATLFPVVLALLPLQLPRRAGEIARSAQAGDLLTLVAPGAGALVGGTIRGPLTTGGIERALSDQEGVEIDPTARAVSLRVPPRETGPIEITLVTQAGPLRSAFPFVVSVLPPTLHDGIRVDGVVDAFESALVAGHERTIHSTVTMQNASTGLFDGVISTSVAVATDPRDVYLRIAWDDATEDRAFDLASDPAPRRHDFIAVEFDSDGDGTFEPGEDNRVVFAYLTGSGCLDQHVVDASGAGESDAIVDGVARMAWDAATQRWTAELLLPRTPDVNGEDVALPIGAQPRFDAVFFDGLGSAPVHPRFGGLFGAFSTNATGWGVLPLPPPLAAQPPALLTPSSGTFVCISSHEHPKGELYQLDFATGNLTRLTFNDRYEDWVSVAPDGSFAVYGASSDQANFNGYEIWSWERSTGLERRLTTNARADGHPAIAPDNWTIAWVSFTSTGVDLFTMGRDGSTKTRVTNDAVEQNDPEWTKDGSLVIKSLQWTGLEQLAVLNLSGQIERRLTDNANSDHDPFVSKDGAWVLYERFEGTIPWTQDWNLTNSTPWTIRMVRRDGSAHRLLVDDGLVNWLPVMGPDGAIAYFSNTSQDGDQIRLIDRFGVERGRLAPRQSHVRYMDWK